MADYTLEELYAKLERAKAANRPDAAAVIADEIRMMEADEGPAPIADFSGNEGGPVYSTEDRQGVVPGTQESMEDLLGVHMQQQPGEARIFPESPFMDKAAYSLAAPLGKTAINTMAGAQRRGAGTVRSVRQLLNEYVLKDPEKVKELEQEEQAARIRDKALMNTGAGKAGSALMAGAEYIAPMGLVTKANALRGSGAMMRGGTEGLTAATVAGLTTPTAPGESRIGDMTRAGLVSAAIPLAGPALSAVAPFIPYYGARKAAEHAISSLTPMVGKAGKIRDEAGTAIGKLTDSLQIPARTLARSIGKVDKRLPKDVQDELRKLFYVTTPRAGVVPRPGLSVPGRDVQLMRKEAGRVSRGTQRAEMTGNASSAQIREATGYEELIGKLDDAVERVAPEKLVKALRRAREQYRTGVRPMSAKEAAKAGIPNSIWQSITEYMGGGERPVREKQKKAKEI